MFLGCLGVFLLSVGGSLLNVVYLVKAQKEKLVETVKTITLKCKPVHI